VRIAANGLRGREVKGGFGFVISRNVGAEYPVPSEIIPSGEIAHQTGGVVKHAASAICF
jgi:hypothetical protein